MSNHEFKGFPKECLSFFEQLERNNNKQWFKEHRAEYDEYVLAPARQFVMAMGEKLHEIVPKINAEPAIDKSIFRIYRDVRFSKDKRPYKTNLAVYFWEGNKKKLECPGFYFHMEKDKLIIGGGMHMFSKDMMQTYRNAVDDKKSGEKLEKILKVGMQKLACNYLVESYKRVPRGFENDHPRAELLKHKGLTLGEETPIPKSIHTAKAVDYVFKRFEKILPLHKWYIEQIK